MKSKGIPKKIYFYFIDYAKAFDCVAHKKTGEFLKRWEYETSLPVSLEIHMWVKKQELEHYMEQLTDSNWERSMTRLYIVTVLI